jgi:hypothetical protein
MKEETKMEVKFVNQPINLSRTTIAFPSENHKKENYVFLKFKKNTSDCKNDCALCHLRDFGENSNGYDCGDFEECPAPDFHYIVSAEYVKETGRND